MRAYYSAPSGIRPHVFLIGPGLTDRLVFRSWGGGCRPFVMRNAHGTIYVGIDVSKDKLVVEIAPGTQLSAMQTDFARTVRQAYGLQRGVEGSRATHERVRQV